MDIVNNISRASPRANKPNNLTFHHLSVEVEEWSLSLRRNGGEHKTLGSGKEEVEELQGNCRKVLFKAVTE